MVDDAAGAHDFFVETIGVVVRFKVSKLTGTAGLATYHDEKLLRF